MSGARLAEREPFGGKYYGIWNVEGDGEPKALFPTRAMADAELIRRQSLAEDDEMHLTAYDQVFPCDIVGAWWNSYEADPREEEPLTLQEIRAVQDGDV